MSYVLHVFYKDFGLVVTRWQWLDPKASSHVPETLLELEHIANFCQGTAASWPEMNWTYTFDFEHLPQSKWTLDISQPILLKLVEPQHCYAEKRWQERFQEAKAISPDTDSPWFWHPEWTGCTKLHGKQSRSAAFFGTLIELWENFDTTLQYKIRTLQIVATSHLPGEKIV